MDSHPASTGSGRDTSSQTQQQPQQQYATLGRLLESDAKTRGNAGSPASGAQEDAQNRAGGAEGSQKGTPKKKRKNRHRRRRNRRQSFLAADEDNPAPVKADRPSELGPSTQERPQRPVFYRGRNLSNTSLESEALLDHR
jgi:magnesium transporter